MDLKKDTFAFIAFFTVEICIAASACLPVQQSLLNSSPSCGDDVFVPDTYNGSEFESIYVVNSIANCTGTLYYNPMLRCTACQDGYYGVSCTEQALCASGCNYSRSEGCKDSDVKICNLNDLTIASAQGDEVCGTVGLSVTITLAVDVNLSPSDAIVMVTVPNADRFVLNATEDGSYIFTVIVEVNSTGQYIFTATALLANGSQSYISKESQVLVVIYDPVTISKIVADYDYAETQTTIQDTITPATGKSLIQLICYATGVAATTFKVTWMYDGGNISEAPVKNRIYQESMETDEGAISILYLGDVTKRNGIYTCQGVSDDTQYTFYDTRSVEWTTTADSTIYASRNEFIITVTVLGAALIIAMVSFAIVLTSAHHKKSPTSLPPNPAPLHPRPQPALYEDIIYNYPAPDMYEEAIR